MTTLRFKNAYQTLTYDFIKDVLVECPKCEQKAIVKASKYSFGEHNDEDVRLICTSCGYNKMLIEKPTSILYVSNRKIIRGRHLYIGGSIDPFFHLPLWLTAEVNGHLLWAYNLDHLDFLEKHISARLRERDTNEKRNKSLGSRLPKWMTSKKNRELLLRAIKRLKEEKK